ncbi:hypothetical protein GCM10009717_04130 [Agromyces allii]|uniref:Cysteine-rich CPCC domain-containing protein n=1 Tax=Agromyces allii TaxID=393607 RepID=A0ABN2Q107_9MICO
MLFSEPPGSYEICDVCYWEDDAIQLRWPNLAGGANRTSLVESQRNYSTLGAMEERFVGMVRDATPAEARERAWRAIDTRLDSFETEWPSTTPWPEDLTSLYWWRPTFWRARV